MQVASPWVRGIWAGAFLVLAGNTVLSSINVNVLIYNDEMVTKTRRAKQTAADLLTDLVAAESSQRGYLITANPDYLVPYQRAVSQLPIRRYHLKRAMAADPEQAARVDRLEGLIDAKVADMDRTLALLDRDGLEAAQAVVREGRGRGLMTQIRTTLQEIDEVAEADLQESSEIAAAKYRATTISNVVGGGLALGMVWLAYSLIRGELKRRQQAEADARLTAAALAKSQKATADALAQLDAFLYHAPVGIAFYDKSLRYRKVNAILAAANRVPAEDHVGRTTKDVLPDFPQDLLDDYERVLATERPVLNRLVHYDAGPDPDRRVTWEVTLFPVSDGQGQTHGLGVFAQDVTLREQAQGRLRDSEDRYRTLADAVPLFVWTTRPDGYHEYYNSRWYEYTGLTPQECLGHGWADPLHPDDAPRARATWKHSLSTGAPYNIEYRFKNSHGEYRWFLSRARPVRDAAGGIVRWFGTCTDIDDAKRLATQLAQSEARLRTLAETVPGFVWSATADGKLDYTNSRVSKYSGLDPDDVLGEKWFDIVHPDDRGRSAENWHDALATGRLYQAEFRLRRADGQYRWFLAQAAAVHDEAGGVEHWYGTTTDIDDFRNLEADLARSQSRFRTLAEAVPGFIFSAKPDGKIDYINPRFEEYTGQPPERTYDDSWIEFVHPDDREMAVRTWQHAVLTLEHYQAEFRVRNRDGSHRWFLVQAMPSFDAAGEVDHWYGSASDIDDFKILSVRASVNAERFRVLTESIPQMVWNADAAGRVTYFNTRWRDYTGLAETAGVEDWWPQVLHPDDVGMARASWRECVGGTPRPQTWEVRVRRAADGTYRWFVASIVPLHRANGTVDQWIGSLSDIDEQKQVAARLEVLVEEATASLRQSNDVLRGEVAERQRAEQRERAAAMELRRSNSELEKFAYVASHDLQEPLRKIQTFGDRLAQRYRDTLGEQGRDYLERMQSSATRMRGLINDLLTFSRVATRTQPFLMVGLTEVVEEVLSTLEVRLAETNAVVEVGLLPRVPGDATQLKQLFQNLLGNALKFAQDGTPPVIRVTSVLTADLPAHCDPPPMADGIRVEISDNGIGFEQVYSDRIFNVFQRLHGRGTYEGTGIGLAICRKIVERHGGGIVARSEPGRGARFFFDLPAEPALVATTDSIIDLPATGVDG